MSIKVDKVNLEIVIKADSARAEIRKLEDEAVALQKGMRNLKKGSDEYVAQSIKLETVKGRITDLRNSIDLNGKSMKELQSRAKELSMQLNVMTPGSEKYVELRTELDQVNGRMREIRTTASGTQSSLNKFSKGLDDIPGPAGNVIQSVKGMGVAMKALLLNPVAIFITLIIGSLMLLGKAFMSTDSGANMFNGVMKAMSKIFDIILDRLVSYIKLIGSIVTLDFEGMKKNATDAFGGIAEQISQAAQAGYNYIQVMDDIEDRENASLIRSSKLRAEIEKLKNQAKDQTLPIKERILLNDLAMAKEIELNKISKGFLQEKNSAEISSLAVMINVQGMSVKKKEQQIKEWLKLDDRQIIQYAKNNARFAEFYNKNEEEFKKLQKLKSEEFDKDAEFEQGTRRLQKEASSFKVDLTNETNEKIKTANEKKIQDDLSAHDKWYNDAINALKKQKIDENKSNEWYTEQSEVIEKDSIKRKKVIYKNNQKELAALVEKEYDIDLKNLENKNSAQLSSIEASHKSINKSFDVYSETQRQKLQEKLDADLSFQDTYNQEILLLDLDVAEMRLESTKKYAKLISEAKFNSEADKKKAIEAADDLLLAETKAVREAKSKITKTEIELEKDRQSALANVRKEFGLDSEEPAYKKSLKALKKFLKDKKATIEESEEVISAYRKEKVQEFAQNAVQITGMISDVIGNIHQAQSDNLEAEKNKELAAAGDNASAREEIEKKYAQKELELRKKQANANMGIQIAQAMAQGALGIAEIWAKTGVNPILAGILTAGLVAVTGAQIAAAVSQRNAIQNQTIGFRSGGYTGDGRDDEPAGTVHRGEFVANAKAVRNPHVRKFLDVFNQAQMNGGIRMLNTTQILQRVQSQAMPGYQTGGYAAPTAPKNGASADITLEVLRQNTEVMSRLNSHIENGITAYPVISGSKGSYEMTKKYQKYITNASRG